ncbi:hypothetical protein MNEG_5971, partial [Monoraphidium neglectum]
MEQETQSASQSAVQGESQAPRPVLKSGWAKVVKGAPTSQEPSPVAAVAAASQTEAKPESDGANANQAGPEQAGSGKRADSDGKPAVLAQPSSKGRQSSEGQSDVKQDVVQGAAAEIDAQERGAAGGGGGGAAGGVDAADNVGATST